MTYRENVQTMCSKHRISNPIREEDLTIAAVSFLVDGNWIRIDGTEMNRAGRLFFQDFVRKLTNENATVLTKNGQSKRGSTVRAQLAAKWHFAENWEDAEEKGRAMLIVFKKATHITIHWKQ